MVTSTTTDRRTGASGGANGAKARVGDLKVSPPRRVRVPELAGGLAAVVLFALGGVLWHLRSIDKTAALALAAPIVKGHTVEADDLRLAYVPNDEALAWLAPEQSDDVVGRIAATDLPAGTLLTEGLLLEAGVVGKDDGVVGLALEPGQYPTLDLAAGDIVEVVATESAKVIASAEVLAVNDLASGERKLVSLRATKAEAGAVAALDQRTVRLVAVSS